jgi:pimeloyl-ACP methyl ester carboxylesterase
LPALTSPAEPVLALHASSSHGGQWRPLADALGERYRVLAPDLLGYGAAGAFGPDRELTSRDEIERLAPLLDTLAEPVHLVGHSYGGLTALRLALSGRVRLRSLTLYEPIAFWLLRLAGETALYGEARAVADAYRAAFARGDLSGAVGPYLDYWNGAGSFERAGERMRASLLATAAKTAREWAPAFEDDMPVAAIAARIDVPVLILHGARTNATTRRICEILGTGLKGARLVAIPEAGHMGPITHAAAVNPLVAGHVAAAPAGLRSAA